jgi:hypothetical protein
MQFSVRNRYKFNLYCCVWNSSATVGMYSMFIYWVLLCVKQQCNCRYVLDIDMVGTAVCERAVQLSVRTVYKYGVYCWVWNSIATVGTYCIEIWLVLLCLEQQFNCLYVFYIDIMGTALCERTVQLSVGTVYRNGRYCVWETTVQLTVRTVYRYDGYCCVWNGSAIVGTLWM